MEYHFLLLQKTHSTHAETLLRSCISKHALTEHCLVMIPLYTIISILLKHGYMYSYYKVMTIMSNDNH